MLRGLLERESSFLFSNRRKYMSDIKTALQKFRREKTLESGKKVQIKMLRTTAGIAVAKKLLNLVAPAIGGAADGMRHDDMIHGAPKSFTHLALTMCEQIDKVQIENIITVLLEDMTIDGKEIDYEEYFSANYGELIEILEFSLRENFETFFTGKGLKARFLKTIQGVVLGQTPEE